MKMEQIECSETSAYIIKTPGNYQKENIIYSEHGESLKSRLHYIAWDWTGAPEIQNLGKLTMGFGINHESA